MEAYLLDWANFLLRWTHVIVAIAWIGSSFYFVFLDFSLTKPTDPVIGALVFLAAFWFVYDAICRLFGERANGDLIVGVLVFVFVVVASWLACRLFAGRAAFLMAGAMIATAMSANVFFWIIPG